MTKKDLKYGNVIETRNGDKYLVAYGHTDKVLVNLNDGIWISAPIKSCYKENLTNVDYFDIDVMKVYKDYTLKELIWERKEKPKLTEDEKVILRSLPKEYKWIARDKRNNLSVFVGEPIKLLAILSWGGEDGEEKDFPFDDLFQFIKWEDNRPYNIRDLLEEDESK